MVTLPSESSRNLTKKSEETLSKEQPAPHLMEVSRVVPVIEHLAVGIPIKGRHDPVLVVPVDNLVEVSLKLKLLGEDGVAINSADLPPSVGKLSQEFLEKLLEDLGYGGVGLRADISVKSGNFLSGSFAYVSITNLIVSQLAGEPLDRSYKDSLALVDRELGLSDSVVALRYASLSKPRIYLWRFREGVVEGRRLFLKVSPLGHARVQQFTVPFTDVLGRASGLLILEFFRRLNQLAGIPPQAEGEYGLPQEIRELIRLYNSLWVTFYEESSGCDEVRICGNVIRVAELENTVGIFEVTGLKTSRRGS